MPEKQPAARRSPVSSYILPVSIFLFGIVLCVAIVFNVLIFFQKDEGVKLDREIEDAKAQVEALLSGDVKKYLDAREVIQGVGGDKLLFSQVLERLVRVLPDSVLVASLSIDSQNKLTVNLVGPDYAAVSDTIVKVRSDPLFANVFLPNASLNQSGERLSVINFPIVMELNLGATPKPSATPAINVPSPSPSPADTSERGSPSPSVPPTSSPLLLEEKPLPSASPTPPSP